MSCQHVRFWRNPPNLFEQNTCLVLKQKSPSLFEQKEPLLMYLSKTPRIIQNLLPSYTWHVPTSEKVIYLTFDDGPVPEATPWVLDTLRAYGAKATFFCVGDNVRKYPEVFQQVLAEGHAVGNHTFNHLKGWETDTSDYLENVARCAQMVSSPLFRPPLWQTETLPDAGVEVAIPHCHVGCAQRGF